MDAEVIRNSGAHGRAVSNIAVPEDQVGFKFNLHYLCSLQQLLQILSRSQKSKFNRLMSRCEKFKHLFHSSRMPLSKPLAFKRKPLDYAL